MCDAFTSPGAGLKQKWDADDNKCDESIASEDGAANLGGQEDRKVRQRTLISEEQFKVVKVWFQNARARDRREV